MSACACVCMCVRERGNKKRERAIENVCVCLCVCVRELMLVNRSLVVEVELNFINFVVCRDWKFGVLFETSEFFLKVW